MKDTSFRLFAGSLDDRAALSAWLSKNADEGWMPVSRRGHSFRFRQETAEEIAESDAPTEERRPARKTRFDVLRVPPADRPESGSESSRVLLLRFQRAGWQPVLTSGGLLIFRSCRKGAEDPLTVAERNALTRAGYVRSVLPFLLLVLVLSCVGSVWFLHRGLSYAAMEGARLFGLIFCAGAALFTIGFAALEGWILYAAGKKEYKKYISLYGHIGKVLFFLPLLFGLIASVWATVVCTLSGSGWFGGFLLLAIAFLSLLLAVADASGEVRKPNRKVLLALPAECLAASILLGALLPTLLRTDHTVNETGNADGSPVYADELPLTLDMLGKKTDSKTEFSRFCERGTSGIYTYLHGYEEAAGDESTSFPALEYTVWELGSSVSAFRFAREIYGQGSYYVYEDVDEPDFGADAVLEALIKYQGGQYGYDYLIISGSRVVNLYLEFVLTSEQKKLIAQSLLP